MNFFLPKRSLYFSALILSILCTMNFINPNFGNSSSELHNTSFTNINMLEFQDFPVVFPDTCDHDYNEETWMFNSKELIFGQIYSRDDYFNTIYAPSDLPGQNRVITKYDQNGKVVFNKSNPNFWFSSMVPLQGGHGFGQGKDLNPPYDEYIIEWNNQLDIINARKLPQFLDLNGLFYRTSDEFTEISCIFFDFSFADTLRYFEMTQNNTDNFIRLHHCSFIDTSSLGLRNSALASSDEIGVLSNQDKVFSTGVKEYYETDTINTLQILLTKSNDSVLQKRYRIEPFDKDHKIEVKDIDVDSKDNIYLLVEHDFTNEYLYKLDSDLNFIWGKEILVPIGFGNQPSQFEEMEISTTDQIAIIGSAGVYAQGLETHVAFPVVLTNTNGVIQSETVFDGLTPFSTRALNTLCSFQDTMWLFTAYDPEYEIGDILIKMDPSGNVNGCKIREDLPPVTLSDSELIFLDSSLLQIWVDTIPIEFHNLETIDHPILRGDECNLLQTDISIDIISANSCTFGIRADLEICCLGEAFLPNDIPVAVYDLSPVEESANLQFEFSIGQDIPADSCLQVSVTIPYFDSGEIHIVANDDQSILPPFDLNTPSYGIFTEECDYSNNVDSALFSPAVNIDHNSEEMLTFCGDFSTTLIAPDGFDYIWDNEQTSTQIIVSDPGIYSVTILDECENVQTKVFNIIQYPEASELFLEPETSYCGFDEDPVDLIAQPFVFQSYEWSVSGIANDQSAIPSTEGYYAVTVIDFCDQIDSVEIFIEQATLDISEVEFQVLHPLCQFDNGSIFITYPGENLSSGIYSLDSIFLIGENQGTPPGLDTIENIWPGTFLLGLRTTIAGNSCTFFHPDTVMVHEPMLPIFSLLGDTTFCFGDTILLQGPENMVSYKWENTSNNTAIACDTCQQTNYVPIGNDELDLFVIDKNGCETRNSTSIIVHQPEEVNIIHESPSCVDTSNGAIIIQTTDSVQYQLNDRPFQASSIFNNLESGNYIVTLLDEYNCSYSYPINIPSPPPIIINEIDFFEIQNGEILTIDPQVSGGTPPYDYQWTSTNTIPCDFCETIEIAPIINSSYNLLISDNNDCQESTTFEVKVSNPQDVYIPNIFSPNGDGFNDIHTVFASRDTDRILSYQIFNKQGILYFEETDFLPNSTFSGWNGLFNGKQLNPDIFICVVNVLFANGEKRKIIQSVALIR